MSTTPVIVQETHFDPWGLELTGLGYQYEGIKANKYLYQGKEMMDDQNLNIYDFHARGYDPVVGRTLQIDPGSESYYPNSPYSWVMNNPLKFVDPSGMFADYYDSDGNHLGNDGEDDDKVYVTSSVTKNEDGIVTSSEGALDLGITHTEFRKQASTVYGESSAFKMNSVTDDLKKEMFAIASVHQINSLAFGAKSKKANEYLGMTPSQINNSKFKTTANAAVINALTGGVDYSFGASMWDGQEQGIFPASNNDRSVLHNGQSFELHMNTMGWNISDSHFETWKANVGSAFQAPQQKAAPANFGNYQNKGLMRLQSTAVYGGTIFWKIK
ncbi:RHS repeat domain-containing protein [Algoriphagus chordae]|nr:RHS repeat-associated core domain-containing protein [Algoriphagus chordae]